MTFSRQREELAAQAETFRLLSCLFESPEPSLSTGIASLRELYQSDEYAVELLDGMAESLEQDDPVALQVDHARLFIGPLQMLAPPYASLYLEAGDRVDGDVTRLIARHYAECGLELATSEKRPADHIAYLFEFLYCLAYRYLQEESPERFDTLERFAQTYVFNWAPRLFAHMEKGADTRYFKNFARLGLERLPVAL